MKVFDKHLKIKFCVFPASQLTKDVIWEEPLLGSNAPTTGKFLNT